MQRTKKILLQAGALSLALALAGVSIAGAAVTISSTGVTGDGAITFTGTTAGVTLGNSGVTSLTVTTDGTGNGEVVLPDGSIGSAEILDGTILNADISSSALIDFSKLATTTPGYMLVATTTSGVMTPMALSGDITVTSGGVTAVGASKVTNAMLAGSIAASKLATTTAAYMLVANASNVPTWVALSGDVTNDSTGAMTIGASKVTNAMLAGSIAASKLATTTAANILVANASEVPTWVASSGDVTVDNAGAFTIGGAKVNLGTMVTSTLPVANGGTGAATLTGLLVGNGTSAVTATTTLAWNYGGTGSAYFKVAGPSAVRTYTFPDADTSILGSPMTTLGDTMYGGASGVTTRLAGNTTAVKQFLSQTGDGGGNSAAPGWATLVAANISDLNSATTGITKVGTITTGAWNGTPIDLSTYATSTLPVANGGTGAATLTGLLVGNGTSAVTATTTLASNYGGTGSGYFAISGPAALRTYTFPDADATILYSGGSATIGSGGTAITKHLSATGSIQFGGGTVATSTCSTGTVTVTGATTNDSVALGPPTDIEAGLVWSGYVSGASTVTVRACAITGTVTSASKTWRADVWQH